MADDICQFTELLQKFLQSDNDQRTQAEVSKSKFYMLYLISLTELNENTLVNKCACKLPMCARKLWSAGAHR